jgi:phosphonoacetaldehyde hydrolase
MHGVPRLEAVIFDWAGTTVDHGCVAPIAAFVEVFRRRGVTVSTATARGPMGTHKRTHIATLCADPQIDAAWCARHGRGPTEADIDAMFDEFVPLQLAVLRDHAPAGIAEGLHAGMRTVGVVMTGNEIGLSEADLARLPAEVRERRRADGYARLRAAGTHEVIDGVTELPALVDALELRLAAHGIGEATTSWAA